jgi:uncharacterized membrane protein
MALESYGVGTTFLFTVFSQISYGLRADLKLWLVVCSDWLLTIFTSIIKWYMQMIQVIYCSKYVNKEPLFCQDHFPQFLKI